MDGISVQCIAWWYYSDKSPNINVIYTFRLRWLTGWKLIMVETVIIIECPRIIYLIHGLVWKYIPVNGRII